MVSFVDKIIRSHLFKVFIGFSFVGVFSTLFSMLLIFIFNELLHVDYLLTYIIAYSLSILASYFMNTYLVFKSKYSMRGLLYYYMTYLASMVLGVVILELYNVVLPDWNKTIISYMVIPFTMLFNFFFVNRIMKRTSFNVDKNG